jgi:hypothetical protein
VRRLTEWLKKRGVDPWLDEESLIAGQDWAASIRRAVKSSHLVLICLSSRSIYKEGFIQREIRYALDTAEEKPEGNIYVVPVRLEPCDLPERVARFHWVDLYKPDGHGKLLKALLQRRKELGLLIPLKESPQLAASLKSIDGLLARLWYLASMTGPGLDRRGSPHVGHSDMMEAGLVQDYHRQAFWEWLSLSLEDQYQDLRSFIALAEDPKEIVSYLEHVGMRQLIPRGVKAVETQLFIGDFVLLLQMVSTERWATQDQPD